ncbi:hypothetical protein PHJA_000208400 [Phtheirospermum japonicum]|uniref:Uncharacterized protein n=1 Tax=Phtheirospermum japonicum TaxID=374723 RepID=A0A830BF29_9LAMI|nr:hypothetical protein PHJA_000208400 [Phtheirospermum japonicum]
MVMDRQLEAALEDGDRHGVLLSMVAARMAWTPARTEASIGNQIILSDDDKQGSDGEGQQRSAAKWQWWCGLA